MGVHPIFPTGGGGGELPPTDPYTSPRVPVAHAARHAAGGNDELTAEAIGAMTEQAVADAIADAVSGIDGLTEAEVTTIVSNATSSLVTSSALTAAINSAVEDLTSLEDVQGAIEAALEDAVTQQDITDAIAAAASSYVVSDDARMSNSRTPTAHAPSHASNGSDAVPPASIGAATTAQVNAVADAAAAATSNVSDLNDTVNGFVATVTDHTDQLFDLNNLFTETSDRLGVIEGSDFVTQEDFGVFDSEVTAALATTVKPYNSGTPAQAGEGLFYNNVYTTPLILESEVAKSATAEGDMLVGGQIRVQDVGAASNGPYGVLWNTTPGPAMPTDQLLSSEWAGRNFITVPNNGGYFQIDLSDYSFTQRGGSPFQLRFDATAQARYGFPEVVVVEGASVQEVKLLHKTPDIASLGGIPSAEFYELDNEVRGTRSLHYTTASRWNSGENENYPDGRVVDLILPAAENMVYQFTWTLVNNTGHYDYDNSVWVSNNDYTAIQGTLSYIYDGGTGEFKILSVGTVAFNPFSDFEDFEVSFVDGPGLVSIGLLLKGDITVENEVVFYASGASFNLRAADG